MHIGIPVGTAISEAHNSGTCFIPSSVAASAGKQAVRSGVVVKTAETISE